MVLILLWCCFRRRALQRKVQEAQIPVEEQEEMMRSLERRETEYMRLQRRKIGIYDFEQLAVIGKGAFGEVLSLDTIKINYNLLTFGFLHMCVVSCVINLMHLFMYCHRI